MPFVVWGRLRWGVLQGWCQEENVFTRGTNPSASDFIWLLPRCYSSAQEPSEPSSVGSRAVTKPCTGSPCLLCHGEGFAAEEQHEKLTHKLFPSGTEYSLSALRFGCFVISFQQTEFRFQCYFRNFSLSEQLLVGWFWAAALRFGTFGVDLVYSFLQKQQ